jgi:hypothetical protein
MFLRNHHNREVAMSVVLYSGTKLRLPCPSHENLFLNPNVPRHPICIWLDENTIFCSDTEMRGKGQRSA